MWAVILAAGESSRFWPLNSGHKSLVKVMGKPLIFYTLESLKKIGIENVAIIEDSKKLIEEELDKYNTGLNIKYIIQDEAKGMGDALYKAKEFLKEEFIVLNAQKIDIDKTILEAKEYYNQFLSGNVRSVFFGEETKSPDIFGIARLKDDNILEIVEKPKKGEEPSNVKVVGVYCLRPEFFKYYEKSGNDHYNFEKALNLYIKEHNSKIAVLRNRSLSLKYSWDLFELNKYILDRYLKNHIGKKAEIFKNATINGNVYIGENVKVFENAVIKGPCYIGDNSVIGNNSLIRDYCNLEKGCLIGAFAEVARTIFESNCHTHSGFFGDSIFARNCRIGAGTITANVRFDREAIKPILNGSKINSFKKSLGAICGENVNIGINCSIMPGALIEKNSIINSAAIVK